MSDYYDLIPKQKPGQKSAPKPSRPETPSPPRPPQAPRPPRPGARPRGHRFRQGLLAGTLTFAAAAALAIAVALLGYAAIAADLDSPAELRNRTSTFQTTVIYDREGGLLNQTFDPNAGRRTVVALSDISPYLAQATIATEDANFYNHPGVDPVALVRALYYATQEGDFVSGGSTIPQQLVKMVYLTPERTFTRKAKEAILASEISRRFSKEQILEIYLNELYYGNFAYGAEAAAETYFSKDVAELTLAEASLLAGLPQLPAYYDPYTHPDRAKERQGVVLGLMVENGMVSAAGADAAWQEPLSYAPLSFDLKAPHFTLYVRQQLEQLLGPDALYKAGLEVWTTLDPRLQEEAERIVQENVALLAANNVSNGALVSMNPRTGEILALVGSADFDNVEIDGQVNMALAPRQPGSTIKPLVYLAAFEQPEKPVAERWTAETLVADIKEEFPDGANPPYVPTNYDGKEHGIMTVRSVLGNSYNIPAVRAMQAVGIPQFISLAERLGITTLTRADYGLSLSLGAGEIPLIEMAGAFGVLANGGVLRPPVAIARIVDAQGNIVCDQAGDRPCTADPRAGQQVINPVDAFLLTDILSDNEARTPAFGENSMLRLSRPVAAKTGTTNDIRDILTVGYTPQLVTSVWVGNADNSPMVNVSGVSGAAPIWNQFMTLALADEPVEEFTPPPGVRQFEVCADTGTLPSPACPAKRMRWFAEDRPPLPADKDLWQTVRVDKNTGQLANEFTPPDAIEERAVKIYPERYRAWAEAHGMPQPPVQQPTDPANQPQLAIRVPFEGETVSGVVPVYGTVNVPNLASFELQYGESHDPQAFSAPVSGPYGGQVIEGPLGQWDTTALREGPHTLRLVARDANGGVFETRVRLFVGQQQQPTVEPTAGPTPVPVETEAPPFPGTPEGQGEATPTWTPEVIVLPTDTPIFEPPTVTPTPVGEIIEGPVETPTAASGSLPPESPTESPTVESAALDAGAPITNSAPITEAVGQ